MPGKTSFIISFQYSPEIVDMVKSLPLAQYHKNLQAWEIPANCLAQALDSLTFLDNIQLITLPDEDENTSISTDLTEEEIRSFKFKPFAHQIEAINFGLQKKHKK